MTDVVMNDLSIYDTNAHAWWDDTKLWLRTLHNMVPARMRYFDRIVPDWSGLRVLDLGCGGGFMSEALAARGAHVTGIDPSVDANAAAGVHARSSDFDIDYRTGVAEALSFDTATFDCVVCVDVLEHVKDLPTSLDEIARVLRPRGIFLFDTINKNALASFVAVIIAERAIGLLPRGTHDPGKFIKPADLKQLPSSRGFDAVYFVGLGPTGLNRRFDLAFGQVPTTLVQYMGHA